MVIDTIRLGTGDKMSPNDVVSSVDENYGTAELNDRGRLTIPKRLRDDLKLDGGTEFEVIREGGRHPARSSVTRTGNLDAR